MNSRKLIAALVLAFVVSPSFSTDASAGPALTEPKHIKTPFRVISEGGTDIKLPPSYILDEPTFDYLDSELKRLETQENRLTVENKVLKDKENSRHWTYIFVMFAAGAAAGVFVGSKL